MSSTNSTTASTETEREPLKPFFVFDTKDEKMHRRGPSGPEIIKALRGARIRFDDRAHRLGRKRAREYRARKAKVD